MLDLVHLALARRLVGTIADDLCSMPKSFASKMIVRDFDDDPRIDRFPFAGSFRAPTARTPGRVAGKSRRFPECFELFRQRRTFARFERRGKPDVIQQAVVIVKAEK